MPILPNWNLLQKYFLFHWMDTPHFFVLQKLHHSYTEIVPKRKREGVQIAAPRQFSIIIIIIHDSAPCEVYVIFVELLIIIIF